MGIVLVRKMKLTLEIVDLEQIGLFGAGPFLRDGAALGIGALKKKSSSRGQTGQGLGGAWTSRWYFGGDGHPAPVGLL